MAGIYVHIPFCKQRCIYCDFYSTALHGLIEEYIIAVGKEAVMRHLDGAINTLYVGGGTPSQLSAEQLGKLVNGIARAHDLSRLEEFTVEVNPDDVSVEYVRALNAMGANRISMGIQSFVDTELRAINRRHDANAAIKAIHDIREAGINNISIDLIYGIPRQTLESWKYSVDTAIATGVQHISCYNLSYEPGTRLWMMRERGDVVEVSEDECVEMYNLLTATMREAGYEHYEISNYGLPGFHSRHNSSYWDGTPYLGLGASAHSYDGHSRYYNPPSIKDYIEAINKGVCAVETEDLTWQERYDEMIMISLRTARGLDIDEVKERFGSRAVDYLLDQSQQFVADGTLVVHGNVMRIPEEAFMVSDNIIRTLMWGD